MSTRVALLSTEYPAAAIRALFTLRADEVEHVTLAGFEYARLDTAGSSHGRFTGWEGTAAPRLRRASNTSI